MKIFTYRYLWTILENEEMKSCVKQVSGTLEEQAEFVSLLLSRDEVIKAVQIYVCEYDVEQIEKPIIVKEVKKDEKA